MRPSLIRALVLVPLLALAACQTDSRRQVLASTEGQLALRQIQTRAFETTDRERMLRTVIATLQDLSFVVDKADATLGSVSGTKLDGYQLRMTVTVRPRGETQLLVRANAEYNLTAVDDPEPYQQFFAALEKSAQPIDGVLLLPPLHLVVRPVEGGVVGSGVRAVSVGESLDQRGPVSRTGTLHGPPGSQVDGHRVHSVDPDTGQTVGLCLLGDRLGCCLFGVGDRDGVQVVGADENGRGLPHPGEVHAGVEVHL